MDTQMKEVEHANVFDYSQRFDDVKRLVEEQPKLEDRKLSALSLSPYYNASGRLLLNSPDGYLSTLDNAQGQYFSRISFPANEKFRSKLSQSLTNEVLVELHDATYKEAKNKNVLLRMDAGKNAIVAFLSSRYNPFDNREVVTQVEHGLSRAGVSLDDIEVTRNFVGNYSLHARLTFSNMKLQGPDGEELYAGLNISNDETGNGSVMLSPCIFRVVCRNGMISNRVAEVRRSYHTAKTPVIAEKIRAACDDLPRFVQRFTAAANVAFERQVPTFTELADFQTYLGGATALTKAEASGVLNEYNTRFQFENVPHGNVYELAQAVARFAQSADPARQTELERTAATIMARNF